VYVKNRRSLDYSDPYKSFPFLNPDIEIAGIVPIFDAYHDSLFPYSELKGKDREVEEDTAGNGITKVFIGTPSSTMRYTEGEPVLIYRIHQGSGQKTYKSAVTSYATITKIDIIKLNGIAKVDFDGFARTAGNKTVFSADELSKIYHNNTNVVMLELVYNGYFGKGHNVTHKSLSEGGYFTTHPYSIRLSKVQLTNILRMGDVNVSNVIVD
jgi:hypothetical protein